MKRKNVLLSIAAFTIVVYFISTFFSFESNIRVIVINKSGNVVDDARLIYFDTAIMIPHLENKQRYETVIDITEEKGESSITFAYPKMQRSSVTLSGYVEGGATKLYRGKITITVLENGNVIVDVKRNPLSIL